MTISMNGSEVSPRRASPPMWAQMITASSEAPARAAFARANSCSTDTPAAPSPFMLAPTTTKMVLAEATSEADAVALRVCSIPAFCSTRSMASVSPPCPEHRSGNFRKLPRNEGGVFFAGFGGAVCGGRRLHRGRFGRRNRGCSFRGSGRSGGCGRGGHRGARSAARKRGENRQSCEKRSDPFHFVHFASTFLFR